MQFYKRMQINTIKRIGKKLKEYIRAQVGQRRRVSVRVRAGKSPAGRAGRASHASPFMKES